MQWKRSVSALNDSERNWKKTSWTLFSISHVPVRTARDLNLEELSNFCGEPTAFGKTQERSVSTAGKQYSVTGALLVNVAEKRCQFFIGTTSTLFPK